MRTAGLSTLWLEQTTVALPLQKGLVNTQTPVVALDALINGRGNERTARIGRR